MTAENFPTLGGDSHSSTTSTAAPRYTAAESLARKNMMAKQQKKQTSLTFSGENFPPPPSLSIYLIYMLHV